MRKVQLGIIGLGYIGQVHLKHSFKIPNAEVRAVADLSKKALAKAKNMGVKNTYSNYEEMLKDPEIEAVIVALPNHLHLQCTRRVAEAKKHIFLEKPIARTVEEAKDILAVSQKHSVKLMVGYPLRHNPAFRAAKTQIAAGLLGDVVDVHATYISSGPFFHRAEGFTPVPVPEWWFNRDLTGGGVLIDLGCHIINLLRWYFGEITSIKAHLGYRFNLDFEDSAICLAQFESGTKAVIDIGWFSQDYALRLDFLGSVKHLHVCQKPSNKFLTAIQLLATGSSKFYEAHLDELQHFLKCVINDSAPSSSAMDGLRDLEAITLAYKNKITLT